MKRLIQILFGIVLIIFGFNHFLGFLPLPQKENFAGSFLETLHQAKYLLPTIAIIQIVVGISLVVNRWAALGLLALLPITFNIFAFHLLHDQAALVPAVVLLGLNIFMLWVKRKSINQLFLARIV